MRKSAIVVYMPVIHKGYTSLIERHPGADIILLTSLSIKKINEKIADQLSRDIRCIPATEVAAFLHLKFPSTKIRSFEDVELLYLHQYELLIMPNEDISHALKEKLPEKEIEFDNAFLRWDWRNTSIPKDVKGAFTITTNEFDRYVMSMAVLHSEKSSDIWRQVGAVVPIDRDSMLCAFNEHKPNSMSPYVNGDPRLHMQPGEKPEICGALHAEKSIIAQASKEKGISLKGKSIYVTTFPCSDCARSIVEAGIMKVFFKEGYSVMDAADILISAGIEVFQVN